MKGLSTQNATDIWQNEMLTVKEVAAFLRVDRVTVWRWCKTGLIPASHIGHHWRIHRDDLLHLLETTQPPLPNPNHASPALEDNPFELEIGSEQV